MNYFQKTSLVLLLVGSLGLGAMFRTSIAEASDGFETNVSNGIASILRVLDLVRQDIAGVGANQDDRFNNLDAKLDRLYDTCRGAGTTRTTVTSAQAMACINSCFTSTSIPTNILGNSTEVVGHGSALDSRRFTACVSRCPSNTLRNIECAQRYIDLTSTYEAIPSQVQASGYTIQYLGHAPNALGSWCANERRSGVGDNAALCREYGEVLSSSLASCLLTQRQLACQEDCDRSYTNAAGYLMCLNRCNATARSTTTFQRMRDSGLLDANGNLSIRTSTVQVDSNGLRMGTPIQTAPVISPTSTLLVNPSATETYPQCVYRCNDERLFCLKNLKNPADTSSCESAYSTCYTSCNAKR